jgi:surface polysaccharide O-acyltransferase-like enzyme
MAKQRIFALEYIRGISMLGVIGIHAGAYSLTNPQVNVHLFALLEIFTRFSVPIFFFVSAFGLFIHQDPAVKLDYRSFMLRRCRTVLIPYLVWSILYMIHYTLISGDTALWMPLLFCKYLLFGLASYQLYFLVILLWFYTFMPLWRFIVRHIIAHPVRNLSILLLLQISFNYYSSYLLKANFANHYLNIAIQHRLSYWVLHYLFIFLLGAVCAVQYPVFQAALLRYWKQVSIFFVTTLAGMLVFYYDLLYVAGYTPEQAVNTDHQLSPIGVLYTLSATLFWFMLFNRNNIPQSIASILGRFGEHSYMVYLVHPLVMYYLITYLMKLGMMMTVPVTVTFYLLTVSISLGIAIVVQKANYFFPSIHFFLLGSPRRTPKSGTQ